MCIKNLIKFGSCKGLKIVQIVLNLCGIWPNNSSRWSSVLYQLYFWFILVVFIFIYDLSLSIYIIFLENVQEAADNLCITLTLITLLGKVLNFKIHQNEIQRLLYLSEEFQLEHQEDIDLVRRRLSLFNKLVFGLYLSAQVATYSMYIEALRSSGTRLPYLGWYPFDWKSNSTTYFLLFLYQTVGMAIQSSLNVGLDLFSAYLMYVGSIKLEILGMRLEKLCEAHQEEQFSQSVYNGAAKLHIESLVKCIATYQQIWKYTKKLQKSFTYGFLVQISFSGAVICFTAYQLTNASPRDNIPLFMFLLFFQICMITQMALPCYFGNEIIIKHESLMGSVFNCGWHLQSMEYRRIVIIFMELVKEKRSILVGNWFDMDLNLFSSIMNFAYRLYAVLA